MVASDPEECVQSGLENVHSACTSKYKHKVCVIRDFPPGCGRLGATISRSGEQAIRQVVYESVNPPLVSDWVDKVECEMKFLGDSELEILKVNEVSGLQKDLHNVVNSENDVFPQTGVEFFQSSGMKIVGNKYYTRGGVTVVRDFPLFCGINAPLLSKEELLKWRTCNMLENSNKSPCGASPNDFDSKLEKAEDKDFEMRLSDSSAFDNQLLEGDHGSQEVLLDRPIVPDIIAPPWLHGKVTRNPDLAGGSKRNRTKGCTLLPRASTKKNSSMKWAHLGLDQVFLGNKNDSLQRDGKDSFPRRSCIKDVSLPHSRTSTGHHNDSMISRNKVRETLRLFQAICRKLLQKDESKLKGERSSRLDYAALNIIKQNNKCVNTGKPIIGSVPGVEVGDEFYYFVELHIVGLHRPTQGGIDSVKQGEQLVATSIIASGSYEDDLDDSDVLWYMGQGGNVVQTGKQKGKQPEDQKLERGNLALANSRFVKNPVRVIRGEIRSSGFSIGSGKTYVYDGLYLVEEYKQEPGPHGKLVYKFKLVRIPGQPEIAWKVVRKSKVRKGLCVHDISQGKEIIPICAINTRDDEKPPSFVYVPHMTYPDWCRRTPSKGCDCINGCLQSAKCSCVMKNGGEIPYNHSGAIVVPKPLVYECGPTCKCPPSCYNRVSQHGIKFQFEIFKTKSRGWGVRSLNSIPSGSFICEYAGELLEDREAEKRTWNDEYLFDIGNNYSDSSLWNDLSTLMPDQNSSFHQVLPDSNFTIDAARFGNMGRFINHSCSPNLYAQNVLYDHNDKRIPHIMLFAVENIPPLQELTYHYNYKVDQVHDENGEIRKKICYCGSSKCTGRLY